MKLTWRQENTDWIVTIAEDDGYVLYEHAGDTEVEALKNLGAELEHDESIIQQSRVELDLAKMVEGI